MAERIVVALGGNALGKTPEQQLELVRNTARPIVDLVEKGYEVIIGHGNGPQVGMINLAMEFSANKGGGTPFMPFPECGAMTQGYIGYHLQQAIQRREGPRLPAPDEARRQLLYEGRGREDCRGKGLHLRRGRRARLPPCRPLPDPQAHRGAERCRSARARR